MQGHKAWPPSLNIEGKTLIPMKRKKNPQLNLSKSSNHKTIREKQKATKHGAFRKKRAVWPECGELR
jgi:hypothetical protein